MEAAWCIDGRANMSFTADQYLIMLLLVDHSKQLKYFLSILCVISVYYYRYFSKIIAKSATFLILFQGEDGRKSVNYLCSQNPETLNFPGQEVFGISLYNLRK